MLRCINFSGWESLQTSQDLPQSLQEATCCQKLEEWWKSSRFPSSQQTPWELERCWRALGIQNWGAEGLSLHTSPHCKPRVGSCWKTSQHRALALQTNLGGWGAFISSNQLFPWLQMENRESSTRWGRDKKGKKGAKRGKIITPVQTWPRGHGGGRGDGSRTSRRVFCLIPDLFNLWDVSSRTGTFCQPPGICQQLGLRCSKGNG